MPSSDHPKIKEFEDIYKPSDDMVWKEKKMNDNFARFCVPLGLTNVVAVFIRLYSFFFWMDAVRSKSWRVFSNG
jgi:hypothetical protein